VETGWGRKNCSLAPGERDWSSGWLRRALATGIQRSRFPDWVIPVREPGDPPGQVPDNSRGGPRRLACGARSVLAPVPRNAQIGGENLARAIIRNNVKIYLLSFLQLRQSGALDGADVDVDVKSSVNWTDETIAFPRIEPFYGSGFHENPSRRASDLLVRQNQSTWTQLDRDTARQGRELSSFFPAPRALTTRSSKGQQQKWSSGPTRSRVHAAKKL